MAKSVVYDFSGTGNFLTFAKNVERGSAKITRRFKTMDQAADRVSAGLTRVGKRAELVGTKLRTMSLVAGAGVVASAKSFGDFESNMIDVINLLDAGDVPKFEAELNALGKSAIKNGFAINDATKGLFDNISALGASKESFAAFEEGQRLAIGGATTLAISVDGITSVMNSYKETAKDATKVSNAFFSAQVKGKVTVAELAQNVGVVAPFATQANISFQELLATMSQLTAAGIPIAESTTAIKGVISALIKPSNEATKVLRFMGVASNLTELQSQSLTKTLLDLAVASEKYPNKLAKAIPNIRGFLAAAALGPEELARIDNMVKLMEQDLLSPAVVKKTKTFNFVMGQTFGSIKILAISIGSSLAPVIKFLGRLIQTLTAVFESFGDTTKTVFSFILVGAAGLSTMFTLVGKGALVMATWGKVLAGLGNLLGALAFAAKFLFAMLVGFIGFWPAVIGLAIAGIVALGAFVFAKGDEIIAFGRKIAGIFGFGDSSLEVSGDVPVLEVSGVDDVAVKHSLDASITIAAEPGTVVRKTKTTSSGPGLNTHTQNKNTF